MSNKVGIVNYGVAGNIYSINKALIAAGAETVVISTEEQFKSVDKIVLPGVGSFNDAMSELVDGGMYEQLKLDIADKPTLGICLGMQILSRIGFEYGRTNGLGVLEAEVKPMICAGKVPHVGYNSIEVVKTNNLLKNVENEEFYFMHSFEVVNYTDIAALTSHGEHQFVSAIHKGNIYGVQFHPEKSRSAGIALFENFVNI